MNSNIIQRLSLLALLTLGLSNIAFSQLILKNSKFSPSSFEITTTLSYLKIYEDDAIQNKRNSIGYNLKAGYRPDIMNRRLLVEAYLLNVPKNEDPLNPAPRISSVGISANYLLLNPKIRINPYLGLGLGTYTIDDLDSSTTPESSANFEPYYVDETMATLTINSGFYVSILPEVALRGDIQLYNPIGSDFESLENAKSRFVYSTGLSFRF